MRVNPNTIPEMLEAMNTSQVSLNTALEEVATGKKVNEPSDDPSAAAEMVQNTIDTGQNDEYTQNVGSVLSMVQTADSALSSVVSSLTQAIALGTEGANGTTNSSNEQSLANQVEGLLTSVVSQANLSYQGAYVFGGTNTTTAPYTADSTSADGYTYNGNGNTNSVAIGEALSIQVNLPGSQIFSNSTTNVIGSLSNLVTALKSGDSSTIATATSAVTTALNYVGQQRVFYGNVETQLNNQDSALQQDTVSLASQQNNLVGIDEATAAENLSQAEVANSSALAAAAKAIPNTLLDYLGVPS